MEILFVILLMILVVSITGFTARFLSLKLPLPLIQIIVGSLLACFPFNIEINFNPELFLVLFIPPLLFVDGWKSSVHEFVNYKREILALALMLVLITVIGIGYLVYWIIPKISLAAAFSLASVLSPTDAVALSRIIGKERIPKKIMSIIQGEALMNDASSLIALKFSISIAMGTIIFNISNASFEFLKIAIGGFVIGIIICYLFGKSLSILKMFTTNNPGTQTILLLLLPFASYLISEYMEVSGILASVSSGIFVTKSSIMKDAPLSMRLRANSVWKTLEFVFNGMVFVMLGLQLPDIIYMSIFQKHENIKILILIFSIFLIYTSLIIVRFIWIFIMQRFSHKFLKSQPMEFGNYSIKEILISSFAGVRGAITLAGVLSIPHLLHYGKEFPNRYEIIFLATGVILLSLTVGVIILPTLLRKIQIKSILYQEEIQLARKLMTESAIKSLYKLEAKFIECASEKNIDLEILKEVTSKVISDMRNKINKSIKRNFVLENFEKKFRLVAIRAERSEVYLLRARRKISNETMIKLLHDLDLIEIMIVGKK